MSKIRRERCCEGLQLRCQPPQYIGVDPLQDRKQGHHFYLCTVNQALDKHLPDGKSASPFWADRASSSGSGMGSATSVDTTVLLSSTNFVVHKLTFLGPPPLPSKDCWKDQEGRVCLTCFDLRCRALRVPVCMYNHFDMLDEY